MFLFARFAYFTVVRDAGVVALAAALLMLAFSFEPPMAFEAGATVALVFSLLLLVRVLLPDRSALYRAARPGSPCRTKSARSARMACYGRRRNWELLLRFAKTAAGIAGILYGSALVLAIA